MGEHTSSNPGETRITVAGHGTYYYRHLLGVGQDHQGTDPYRVALLFGKDLTVPVWAGYSPVQAGEVRDILMEQIDLAASRGEPLIDADALVQQIEDRHQEYRRLRQVSLATLVETPVVQQIHRFFTGIAERYQGSEPVTCEVFGGTSPMSILYLWAGKTLLAQVTVDRPGVVCPESGSAIRITFHDIQGE